MGRMKKNAPGCNCCSTSDCDDCPNGELPTGFESVISGFPDTINWSAGRFFTGPFAGQGCTEPISIPLGSFNEVRRYVLTGCTALNGTRSHVGAPVITPTSLQRCGLGVSFDVAVTVKSQTGFFTNADFVQRNDDPCTLAIEDNPNNNALCPPSTWQDCKFGLDGFFNVVVTSSSISFTLIVEDEFQNGAFEQRADQYCEDRSGTLPYDFSDRFVCGPGLGMGVRCRTDQQLSIAWEVNIVF